MTNRITDNTPVHRHVVVNEAGQTVNAVIWDGVTPWHPGEALVAVPEAEIVAEPPDRRAAVAIAKWEAATGLTARRDGKDAEALDAAPDAEEPATP